MRKIKNTLMALCALMLAVGAQAKVMETSVATVNGRPVLSSEYESYLEGVLEQYKANAPQFLEQPYAEDMLGREVLKELISKELLYQAADEAKIQVKDSEIDSGINEIKARFMVDEKTGKEDQKGADKRFNEALKKQNLTLKRYKEKIKNDIAVKKLLETRVQATVTPVEEKDARALFDDIKAVMDNKTKRIKEMEKENPAHLKEVQVMATRLGQLTSEQVKVGHIFLLANKDALIAKHKAADKNLTDEEAAKLAEKEMKEKEALIKKIKQELNAGTEFGAAVRKYSEDKNSLASGGDMILIKGIAGKEIDAKAFTLAVGKTSDPIKTDLGWHIIKIKEKRAKKDLVFEEIAQDLGQYLAQQRIQLALGEYINGLAEKADVKITITYPSDKILEEAAAKQALQEEAAKQKAAGK